MGTALFWGLVGGFALILGAYLPFAVKLKSRTIAYIMAFGAGTLISAVAYELVLDSLRIYSGIPVAIGLAIGSIIFFIGDLYIDRAGGLHRKRSGGQQSQGSSLAISLGALLDGVPESFVLGSSLVAGGGVSAAFISAVFLSNMSEAISASTGLLKAGWPKARILLMWTSIMALSGISAATGYAFLFRVSKFYGAFAEAFAAGAILTMLADTMMPEAFESAGDLTGPFTVLGFIVSTALTVYG